MPADSFDFKRITDPVHGTIGVSSLEAAVIDTAVFQRLHDIKQLGLAPLVYPGANYSRFSHCLGACHVAGRIMRTLLRREGREDDEAVQTYRLAGLLHDIGHLPFSHAMERAVQRHYSLKPASGGTVEPGEKFSHELIGGIILQNDAELHGILGEWADRVHKVLKPDSNAPYRNIISSDLDADRLDYLLRTAHFTGLPYGSVDIDYIVSRFCLDDKKRVALTRHGLRAADQFLLSRYFDYRQVAYHKTTAALEWILEDLIGALLAVDVSLNLSRTGVNDLVKRNEWKRVTDSHVREWVTKKILDIRQFPIGENSDESAEEAETLRRKAQAFLDRRPPKMVGEIELFEARRTHSAAGDRDTFKSTLDTLERFLDVLAQEFSIHRKRWKVWYADIVLTKVGSRIPVKARINDDKRMRADYDETILLAEHHGGPSRPIVDVPQSLTHFMADYNMRMIRIYVLLDEGDNRKEEIEKRIKEAHPHEGWTSGAFTMSPLLAHQG